MVSPRKALKIVMMIACPTSTGGPRLPKIGREEGHKRQTERERDGSVGSCSTTTLEDAEAWTIPLTMEAPHGWVAMLIRASGGRTRGQQLIHACVGIKSKTLSLSGRGKGGPIDESEQILIADDGAEMPLLLCPSACPE